MDYAVNGEAETDTEMLPEDAMEDREVHRLISEIIDQLPANHRAAIVAFYYNQMSVSEIAQMMEVPENTVKTYLFRGKSKIKAGVEDLEKLHGTKLYAIPFAALLFFVFGEEAQACELPTTGMTMVNSARAAAARNAATAGETTGAGVVKSAGAAKAAGGVVAASAKAGTGSAVLKAVVIGLVGMLVLEGGFLGTVIFMKTMEKPAIEDFEDEEEKKHDEEEKDVQIEDVDTVSDPDITTMENEETRKNLSSTHPASANDSQTDATTEINGESEEQEQGNPYAEVVGPIMVSGLHLVSEEDDYYVVSTDVYESMCLSPEEAKEFYDSGSLDKYDRYGIDLKVIPYFEAYEGTLNSTDKEYYAVSGDKYYIVTNDRELMMAEGTDTEYIPEDYYMVLEVDGGGCSQLTMNLREKNKEFRIRKNESVKLFNEEATGSTSYAMRYTEKRIEEALEEGGDITDATYGIAFIDIQGDNFIVNYKDNWARFTD